jgi:hypothetical protein
VHAASRHIRNFPASLVVDQCWALAKAREFDLARQLLPMLAAVFVASGELDHLSSRDAVCLLYSFAAAKVSAPQLFAGLLPIVLRRLSEAAPEHLGRVLWSLSQLGLVNSEIALTAAAAVRAGAALMDPQDAVLLLWLLSGFDLPEPLHLLAETCAEHAHHDEFSGACGIRLARADCMV